MSQTVQSISLFLQCPIAFSVISNPTEVESCKMLLSAAYLFIVLSINIFLIISVNA